MVLGLEHAALRPQVGALSYGLFDGCYMDKRGNARRWVMFPGHVPAETIGALSGDAYKA